jgi:glutamine cyclotransferase
MSLQVSILLIACFAGYFVYSSSEITDAPMDTFVTYKRDHIGFTQGLYYIGNNTLIESTGWKTKSRLNKIKLDHEGKVASVEELKKLDDTHFGEGITEYKGKIYQLTW